MPSPIERFLTVSEFERTMARFERQLDAGFTQTHSLQRETNGRLLKAEQQIVLLDEAHTEYQDAAREARTHWSGLTIAIVSAILAVVGGALLLGIEALVLHR